MLRFRVGACKLLDLRAAEHAELYARAGHPWQPDFRAGREPKSWSAADDIRAMGYDGLIDPSRRRPGLWHITLFRWNQAGAPVFSRSASLSRLPCHWITDNRLASDLF
ncbi:RES domain-containing protein [Sneathiella glossodoripedis]|uniref:RES domain-containing protein n=1 Tax=Sneathiella glossodoripedis TaxID=418853 RepID=UPI0004711E19|nr:RES domain-containing protein [Sneathiella glossodoripedis]